MPRPAPSAALVLAYRAIVRLYPPGFRHRFSHEMVCDFSDATREAWQARRWVGMWLCCRSIVWDVLCTLPWQWAKHGWPAVVGASVAAMLSSCALLAQFGSSFDGRRSAEQSPDELLLVLSGAVIFLLITTTIIFTVGFWLLVLRRSKRA